MILQYDYNTKTIQKKHQPYIRMVDATMEQNLKLLFKTYLLLTKCLIINEIKEIISKSVRALIPSKRNARRLII